MIAEDYFRILVEEIHTSIIATVDDHGLPVTAAIDIMDYDENGLYFLTAKGKSFYDRLVKREYLALTALKGEETMSRKAISIRGKVRKIGYGKIPELFRKNPYMCEIYPNRESMRALTAFQIYQGTGEWFDLSKKPIERAEFSFGNARTAAEGFMITDQCIRCGNCLDVCPQKCISMETAPYIIEQNHCLHCGNCFTVCPVGAIERRI